MRPSKEKKVDMRWRHGEITPFIFVQCIVFIFLAGLIAGGVLVYYENATAPFYWIGFALVLLFIVSIPETKKSFTIVIDKWWDLDRAEATQFIRSAVCSTAAFSAVAYGFLFANEMFSHDSITLLRYRIASADFLAGLGRILLPFYRQIKGNYAAPWLSGLLFILWMTLAGLTVIRLLDIKSRGGRILTPGLLCCSQTLILTGATYVYALDDYALALFLSVAAAYFLCRCRYGLGLGILCTVLSLLFYQPYFTVALAMCFLAVMKEVTEAAEWKRILWKGIKCLLALACSFCIYYLIWGDVCSVLGVEKKRLSETALSGGLEQLILCVPQAYRDFFQSLIETDGGLGIAQPVVGTLALLIVIRWLVGWLKNGKLPVGNQVLLTVLLAVSPMVFCAAHILMNATDLTDYAVGLFYVLLLCVGEPWAIAPVLHKKQCRLLICGILSIVLWQNVVFANQVYMKKDLEKNATLVLAARVIDRIEQTDGYIPGKTRVAFVGAMVANPYLNTKRIGMDHLYSRPGLHGNYSPTHNFGQYITSYLNYPIVWGDASVITDQAALQDMPAFPMAGSVGYVDGILVVKLS